MFWLSGPVLAAVLWGLTLRARGGYEHTCDLATRRAGPHRSGICGINVHQTLSDLCNVPVFRGDTSKKRAAPSGGEGGDAHFNQNIRGLLLNKKDAFSYLNKREPRGAKHGSQGITCECCYNQCSVTELLQYCP